MITFQVAEEAEGATSQVKMMARPQMNLKDNMTDILISGSNNEQLEILLAKMKDS